MRVLVCVDLSPASEAVAEFVVRLGATKDTVTSLLHVADPEPAFVGYSADTREHRDVVAKNLRDTHTDLETLAKRLRDAGLAIEVHMVRGAIAETILETARRVDAELIVVGSNGHNRLRNLVVGSVTDALLRDTPVPITIVPLTPPSPAP